MSYIVKDGVKMNANLHGAASEIAKLVPFDIVVTSGIRNAKDQANAMFGKIIAAGNDPEILIADYKDNQFAQGVIDAWNNGQNLQQATNFLQSYYLNSAGSNHFSGSALDFRTTGGGAGAEGQLNQNEVNVLIQATKDLGYTPYQEYSPPHLHVKVGQGNAQKKNLLPIFLIGGLIIWISQK